MSRSVKGRLYTRGKSKVYYLQYYLNGKEIRCALKNDKGEPITTKAAAQKAANALLAPLAAKDEAQRRQQAVDALKSAREKASELERKQKAIKLDKAFELAMAKPRGRTPSDKVLTYKKSYWDDFVFFLNTKYPDILHIDEVTCFHAQEYTQYITNNGKFQRDIKLKSAKKGKYQKKINLLSPRTVNGYITAIKEVFSLLQRDVELSENPFSVIPKQKIAAENRDAFSLEELELISKTADDFTKAIFIVGLCTGLRERDICCLKWADVDFKAGFITRKTGKTGKEVNIPILPPLAEFLREQKDKSEDNDYVLPEHAKMYQKNSTGITYRVKQMLESNEIETTRKTATGRAVSIKGVHSLRHSFCYYCGLYNIPLAVVQAAVGHMTPEMTKHYSMHATKSDMQEAFAKLPYMFGVNKNNLLANSQETERDELLKLISRVSLEKVKKTLVYLKEL